MNEFETIFYTILIGGLFLILVIKYKRKKFIPKSEKKVTNQRGINLDLSLEKKKGFSLSENQKLIITENIGLYSWLPDSLIQPWEERILCFLDEFPITYMKRELPTEEMKILVAAEACLLILKRSLSDYRHLKAIHIWEDEIEGYENAKGNASRFEINLSWKYLKSSIKNARDGHNLTIHEFAHLIDFADDGIAQSIPVSKISPDYNEWLEIVDSEHASLMKAYESGKNYSIRAYGGYKSINGSKPEIFSCGTTAFFERGSRLKRECPKIYNAFKNFYGLDPASWRKDTNKF